EVKKTWSFRRSTVAKREMPVEAATDSPDSRCPVRRSGRQPKRTDKLEEFLSTAKRAQRKSAPPSLESGDPPSQTPTDAETASEASFDGNADTKALEDKVESPAAVKNEGSSDNEEDSRGAEQDSDRKEDVEQKAEHAEDDDKVETEALLVKRGPIRTYVNKKRAANKGANPVKGNKVPTPVKRETKPKATQGAAMTHKPQTQEDNDENDSTSSSSSSSSSSIDSDEGGYDPNALYCICRQKHNKRFMICCDRCEEWFHGDCVGITEARGRLMERNGEDYICPNCTAKKNQVLSAGTSAEKTDVSLAAVQALAAAPSFTGAEEKGAEDIGIKGRIEKATNPTGKKKIKIFQPEAEDSSLPKCIGPGCENNAQPDSVYCGNGCILRHAAAAMKSITDEPKQKDAAKAQKTTAAPKFGLVKCRSQSRLLKNAWGFLLKSESEEDHSADPDDDGEDEHAEEHPPPPATASWSSDHNYIAVTPEKTTPISPTVLNKNSKEGRSLKSQSSCALPFPAPPKEDKPSEKEQKEKDPTPEDLLPASPTPVKGNKKSPTAKAAKVPPKGRKPSPQAPGSKVSKKPAAPSGKTAAKSKKPGQAPARAPSRFPPHSSTSRPPHSAASAPPASSMQQPPNNQMRTNIRRSLTDIIYKRVSDSDDLKKTETEVAKLSVAIEKEMFNLCLNTDSRYKNKYRSLMFNLKDPKNKGLFYRVVGGEVSPFRLVRLSAEELLSKEISEWKKPDAAEVNVTSLSLTHRTRVTFSPHSMDMEDAPPTSDTDDPDEGGAAPSASAQPSVAEGNSGMLDIFGTMLKDTTSQHRTHLFDLNCKICTGQKTEDEPSAKKAKLTKKPDVRPARQEQHLSRSGDAAQAGHAHVPPAHQHHDPPSYPTHMEPAVPESLQQLDFSMLAPQAQVSTPIAPTVSSVSISRRDPRMARHSAGVSVSYPAAEKPANASAEPLTAPVGGLVDVAPKAPLPMPPAPPPLVAASKTAKSTSEPPPDGETAIFLHGQEKIWRGLIDMQSVAKFVTKAYLVSGSFEHLKEDLPDVIHVGGRICPSTVWDYVGKLKTSLSKELCLIRFHPATEEEEVAYVSLFSYFSSRKRFGVAKNNRRIKDLYLIPLSSKDPLPSKLLPFDGPGLEPARPNLLLGLLICQKDRKRSGAPLEMEEKRLKTQTKEADDTGLPKPSPSVRTERSTRQSLKIPFSTTPPGSPPPNSSETSSTSVATSSVLSFASSLRATSTSTTTGKDSPSSSSSAATTTPLETILKTLFGKKSHDSEASNSPSDQGGELPMQSTSMLDPIVQQFAQSSKGKQVEVDEDDRPYDPEEEYDPGRGYSAPKKPAEVQFDLGTNECDDVAYDPEDDSIFEDVKPVVPGQVQVATESLTDPQKILENLKKIGEQVFQKQGEQPTSSMGKASLSLSDTLFSQPTKSLLANTQLLQLGKKVEELVKSSSVTPLINQNRDPRQSRDPRQAASGRKPSDEPEDQEETSALMEDSGPFPQAVVQAPVQSDVTELPQSSAGTDTALPREEVKTSEESDYEENSQDASSHSYYDDTSTIPVLTQNTTMTESPNEYRAPADIPPSSNFPPLHPMQRPPPPMHVPPPVRGPLPMPVDNSQQYGPPPTAYPPYQNQWPGSQPPMQQQHPPPRPPPQNIMPLRGPPPFPPMAQRGPAPQMFNPPIPQQHIGQQGLPPGLPPPPFDGQNSLPPPRFAGPPPPFNFPANRGPPPPFTGPPPSPFENRLPPPSHFPGPRGPPPAQYGDRGAQPPIVDQPRGPAEHYSRDISNSFKQSVDQNPNPLHIFKDNQGPPPGPAYRGPTPNQYEDRRGPPSSGEMSGQHFNPHNQYESSRLHSPPTHRVSFEEHRGPLPQENRPHPPQRFGGSERYRLDRHSDEARPVRHSGPLLPTPPEAPIGPPSRIRFEGGHREPAPGPPQPPEERQRELPDECRREREREVPHPGRPPWDRGQERPRERDPASERPRERDPASERPRERDPASERPRERDQASERPRDRDQASERPRDRDQASERPRERDQASERPRERDQNPERPRERDQNPERPRERDQNPERPRERDIDSERPQERDQDSERNRERDRDPVRRDSDRRDSDRDRARNRERDRRRDRSRSRERDRDRRDRSRSKDKREEKKDSKNDPTRKVEKTA
uniref:Death inducer-obliterator 1 n=1 Tax=Gasterosteus aculeatus TaxID=69293 RepID=G3P6J1_GASAC